MEWKHELRMLARNLYKTLTLHLEYPRLYRRAVKTPVNPRKVVFLEVRQSELTDSFHELYRALEARGDYELATVCIREGMQSRQQVRRNCRKAIPVLADAAWILVNDSCYLLSSLPLRSETKVIQLWHACGAFKKFGYSTADRKFGATKAELQRFPVHKNFTYVTVSSPEVRWAYAEAFHMDISRILAAGISRTDVFYNPAKQEAARAALQNYLTAHGVEPAGEASDAPEDPAGEIPADVSGETARAVPGRKILLYAPTFRGRVADAVSPDVLDFQAMHEKLGGEWIFLCKHHPFVKHPPVIPEACRSYTFDVSKDLEIEQLLMVSDVCISDYSSLIFEYSLFERPMLFLDYDLEDYHDWRGFYYPLEELTPGPIVRNTEEVIDYLADLDRRFSKEEVHAFREKFMSSCDGHATERILRLMDGTEDTETR